MHKLRIAEEHATIPNAKMARLSSFLSLSKINSNLSMNSRTDTINWTWDDTKMPKPITEQKAKKQLAKMLQSFTPGSVLHLLADHLAEESGPQADSKTSDQIQLVCHALIVVGAGIDVVLRS